MTVAGPSTPVPGLHRGVPIQEYLDWDVMSAHRLFALKSKDPARVRYEIEHPKAQTPAQAFGAAVHCQTLEGDDEYARRFALKMAGGSKVAKEANSAATESGRTLLSAEPFSQVLRVTEAIRAHPKASKLFNGESEVSAVWRDKETGLLAKGRFDSIGVWPCIPDLKTTQDIGHHSFKADVYRFGYHVQAALYLEAAEALELKARNGDPIRKFVIVAVEKEPPYPIRVISLGEQVLSAGRKRLRKLKRIWAACVESGDWPGPPENVEIMDEVPAWELRDLEGEL